MFNFELPLSAMGRLDKPRAEVERILMTSDEPCAETTVLQYLAGSARMLKLGLLPEQIGAKSRGSYNFYRAAMAHGAIGKIRRLYSEVRSA